MSQRRGQHQHEHLANKRAKRGSDMEDDDDQGVDVWKDAEGKKVEEEDGTQRPHRQHQHRQHDAATVGTVSDTMNFPVVQAQAPHSDFFGGMIARSPSANPQEQQADPLPHLPPCQQRRQRERLPPLSRWIELALLAIKVRPEDPFGPRQRWHPLPHEMAESVRLASQPLPPASELLRRIRLEALQARLEAGAEERGNSRVQRYFRLASLLVPTAVRGAIHASLLAADREIAELYELAYTRHDSSVRTRRRRLKRVLDATTTQQDRQPPRP